MMDVRIENTEGYVRALIMSFYYMVVYLVVEFMWILIFIAKFQLPIESYHNMLAKTLILSFL